MRGRLGRYALWQLRDFTFERGLPLLVIATLLYLPAGVMLRGLRARPIPVTATASVSEIARQSFTSVLPTFALIAAIIAINGIISTDRKRGYARFLFAKPVSPARYYLQSFLVHWVGLLIAAALVFAAFAAIVYPLVLPRALLVISLYFLALGGLGFLLSTITRHDWVALGGVWVVAQLVRGLVPPERGWYGRVLDVVLPPVHRVGAVSTQLLEGTPLDARSLLWIAGYGAAAVAVGLLVLRRRPLTS